MSQILVNCYIAMMDKMLSWLAAHWVLKNAQTSTFAAL